MKTKFRYKIPLLVNLSAESALGVTCLDGLNNDYMCNGGSCPTYSQCAAGTGAQGCYTMGNSACGTSSNANCLGCCWTGNSPGSIYPCACSPTGNSAAWTCGYGGNDGQHCGSGGNYENCY
jgi:hypothetical protein